MATEKINKKSFFKLSTKTKLIFFVLLPILVISLYFLICSLTYSTGSRSGIVIKMSKKGYLFKTFEGEINLGGISDGNGTLMPTKVWQFSVDKDDTAIYNAITNSEGKHVRLTYKEVYKTFFWRSETPYFITHVDVVK